MNAKALDHTESKIVTNLRPSMVFSPVVFLHPALCNHFFCLNGRFSSVLAQMYFSGYQCREVIDKHNY